MKEKMKEASLKEENKAICVVKAVRSARGSMGIGFDNDE